MPNPRLSGLAFGSHLELNPSSTRPRGRKEDAGDGTRAEICVAHICLGSHHAFVEDSLSASASWPKSSLRHRTSCPEVPCGFHSEMPPWLALSRCRAASQRCQAELGSVAEVHQDVCPHAGPGAGGEPGQRGPRPDVALGKTAEQQKLGLNAFRQVQEHFRFISSNFSSSRVSS